MVNYLDMVENKSVEFELNRNSQLQELKKPTVVKVLPGISSKDPLMNYQTELWP